MSERREGKGKMGYDALSLDPEEVQISPPEVEEIDMEMVSGLEIEPEIKVTDPFHLGNCYAWWYINHNPVFVAGPQWILFVVVCSFIVGLTSVYIGLVLKPNSTTFTAIGVILVILQVISYFLVSFLNPGIPDRNPKNWNGYPRFMDDERAFCRRCKVLRIPNSGVYHCRECDLCVEGYDHHCPWVTKCVGKKNICYFYLFLITTCLLFVFIPLSTTKIAPP